MFARHQLAPILDMSGRVLYSAAETLKPYPLYLLGHNPGGSPENPAFDTIRSSLDLLPSKTTNNYLDESWAGCDVGRSRLQTRVCGLLEALGHEPRDVPASNLVFVRSRDAGTSQLDRFADVCWPVHEQILAIVRPKVVIVFGNSAGSPYSFFAQKYGAQNKITVPSGHGSWLCKAFEVPGLFRVVGLPHLSRYKITAHAQVIDWLKGLCAEPVP